MLEGGVVPEGLAVLPPGAGLAAALAAVEMADVPNDRILEVLRAQHRQLCHEQARMAAVLYEVGRCSGFPEPGEVHRQPEPDRYGSEESRAALCWTRRSADDEHDLAEKVVGQWPAVFTAWLAGDIDRPRVRVFDRYLTGLAQAHVTAICQVAVLRAARLTTGQLAVLLRRMVIAIDPDAAARWYRAAVAERNVIAYAAPDGTITLTANGLPADEAEAACIRLQDLASAAKRAGHPARINQIRCDLFLGMLDGRFHHQTNEQVIASLLADAHGAHHPAGPPADELPDTPESAAPDGAVPDGAAPDGAAPDSAATTNAAAAETPASDVRDPGAVPEATEAVPGGFIARDERVGIEIRIALSTLLGLDDHPAEIPGLGLLPAPQARHRVSIQRRAQWRFALTNPDGRLVFDGITRRRPRHTRRDGPPGGIVELHIPLSLLTELLTSDTPASSDWADLIADIATQYAASDTERHDLENHPNARLPGAALRRHTEIRDRTCTFIGCRRRAHTAHQDHTYDHHHGGPTTRTNLGPLCPHDHQVKHNGGWLVTQPQPGTFIWRSPLGGHYRTGAEPLLPAMPHPAPTTPTRRLDSRRLEPQPEPPASPILRSTQPTHPPHQRPSRHPPRGDPDEPPPF